MLSHNEILDIFKKSGALLSGHFQLTSGLHSDAYFQCALVLQYPEYARRLCETGWQQYRGLEIDCVIAPAVGGIVVGYELARQLGARALFAEREEGVMQLRRGFSLEAGARVVVAEDVVTTGGSVKEVVRLAQARGAHVAGVFAIVDRSGGKADFGVPFTSTVQFSPKVYEPDACPLCRGGRAIEKPGSRELGKQAARKAR